MHLKQEKNGEWGSQEQIILAVNLKYFGEDISEKVTCLMLHIANVTV